MQSTEGIPIELDEVTAEIASILAKGFMRCRKGVKFSPDVGIEGGSAANIRESEAITEKPLDCSRRL